MLTELEVNGILFVCRRTGQPLYDPVDIEMLGAFARHAALLFQLATARHDNDELRIDAERRQLAEDIRTTVIQRISRLGVDLSGLAARSADPTVKSALQDHVTATDDVIRELRSVIFGLSPPAAKGEPPAGD
jgi:signal transduction histidine kinase